MNVDNFSDGLLKMGFEIKIFAFWNFASFKDIFETQEDDNSDDYFATNRIPAALIEGALALVNENILPIENSALHLRLKLMKVASTFENWNLEGCVSLFNIFAVLELWKYITYICI